jgi:hypothetical protein
MDGKPSYALMDVNYSIIPLRPAGGAWSNVRALLKYVAGEARRYFDDIATARKLLTLPADPGFVGKLAARYTSPALGDITVRHAGDATVFDFGEWKSTVATRREPDGSVTFVTISPGMVGIPLVAGGSGEKRTLTVRDAQHEYVFAER